MSGLRIKNKSPEIISALSCIGVIATGISSVLGYKKSLAVTEQHNALMEDLREKKDEIAEDYGKEVTKTYLKTAVGYVKAYGPTIVTAGLTITGIYASNKKLRKRCVELGAAYSGARAAFASYRERVAEKYGKEAESELYHGVKRTEVVETVIDKKGREKVNVEVTHEPIHAPNVDVIFLDSTNPYWRYKAPNVTYYYIKQQQTNFTEKLRRVGYVFVNEVREAFNLEPIPEGQLVGWVFDDEGDNFIDFGLEEGTENFDLFISGKNEFVYLNLNHDGLIYEKFPQFDRVGKREYQ